MGYSVSCTLSPMDSKKKARPEESSWETPSNGRAHEIPWPVRKRVVYRGFESAPQWHASFVISVLDSVDRDPSRHRPTWILAARR